MSSTSPVFAENTEASTQTLRRVAARNLGLDALMPSGTVAEYGNLSRDDQIRLTDEMAHIIVQYPAGWPDNVVASAQARFNSNYYNTPLADESMSTNLVETMANGSFFGAAFLGGAKYLAILGVAGAIALVVMNSRNNK